MTDEELEDKATAWIRSQGWSEENLPSDEYLQMRTAYVAGAKENGVVWHDLRKNPDDLPKEAGEYICIYSDAYGGDTTVIAEWNIQYQDEGEGHYLKMDENFVYNGIDIDDVVIAWCEIPKFGSE